MSSQFKNKTYNGDIRFSWISEEIPADISGESLGLLKEALKTFLGKYMEKLLEEISEENPDKIIDFYFREF